MVPSGEKLWSLQPGLHRDVVILLKECGLRLKFNNVDGEEGCIREKDTSVMGSFVCRNKGCRSGGWTSKRIGVTIREYVGGRYNARVYHQRCRKCGEVGRVELGGGSYVERVADWIKRWHGVEVPVVVRGRGDVGRRPHDSRLCAGCLVGRCVGL